jgi:hypothetical protein
VPPKCLVAQTLVCVNYFLSFLGFLVSFFWFMPLAIDNSPFDQVSAFREALSSSLP